VAPIASISALALSLGLAGSASAAGFYIEEQSVKGLGRAYSGEAADTGAESLWWNPAAIGDVEGAEVYGGLNGIFSSSKVTNQGTLIDRPGQGFAPVGGSSQASNPLKPGLVPNLDAAWRVNDHIALGLAISAPFDFITKYDASSFTRYQALTSKLIDLDVQPTIAFHVNRYLNVGVGFDAQYTNSTLSSALPNLSPLLPDGTNELKGNAWDYGYTVGAQLHPNDRLSLGVSYRSAIQHDLSGTVTIAGLLGPIAGENGVLPGSAKFTTPWIVVLGGHYKLDDHWVLNAQVQRIGWSEFNTITVNTAAGVTPIPQDYHDTTTEAVGVDYIVNKTWTLRAGAAYDPTPTPSVGRSFQVPDGDRILLTVGGTMRPTAHIELDGALGYVHLQRSSIDNTTAAYVGTPIETPVLDNGQVSGDAVIVSLGGKYKF
jgi:long-chain fatty acid transport protein